MEFVCSVAGTVAECTFGFIKRRIEFIIYVDSNFQNLKDKVAKLEEARTRVQHDVERAIRNAEKIEADVQTWLANVDTKMSENGGDKLEQDEEKANKKCFIGLCPNFKSRYQLSKKAVEEAQAIIQLLGEGKFDKVSYSPPSEGVATKGYKAFESRNDTMEEIMAALRESSVRIVGIHGMPGVGKTTLAKEVAVRLKEEHLFDEVAMATVSNNPDTINIQGEIGDKLDLKYDKETVSGRAMQLRKRLETDKRILIVLDDLWRKLDLDVVGISFQDEAAQKSSTAGCKILLTSRYLNVLELMNVKKNFKLEILSQPESMNLFTETVGDDRVRKSESIADELVKKCQGLPVAILAIANALKGKDDTWWEDALRQLQQSDRSNIEGMEDDVYSTIELSYKWLRDDELQSLFLICGLHPQSFDIPVFDLLQYSMGLDLLEDINKLEEARKRIHVLVQKLKASSLLLEGKGYGWVKMHDLIRDVSISIASKGLKKRMLLIKDGNDMNKLSKKGKLKGCTAISLPHSNIAELSGVDCSNLELLMLLNKDPFFQVSDTFFKDMRNLKVLSVTGVSFPSLPSSFVLVENLQTLRLCECKLSELGMIEKLKKLDILSFQGSSIKQLPVEVAQLTQLKLLDLSECSELEVIPADVIGKLCRLEELLVGNSFRKWDVEGNTKVAELNNLSSLSALDVSIPDDRKLPEQVLSRLERYKIVIGDFSWNLITDRSKASKALQLETNTSNGLDKGIEVLVKKAEELHIKGFKGGKDMVCGLDTEGFPHLKYLTVRRSSEIEWIVNFMSVGLARREAFPVLETMKLFHLSNLERICHDELLKTESFSQLKSITVGTCGALKNLFSSSIAKNLINQLREIYVGKCDNMTEIVEGERKEENEVIEELEFRRLCSLELLILPKLKSFYTEKERASSSGQGEIASNSMNTTESKVVSLFNTKVTFPAIKDLTLMRIAGIERIWQDDILWVTNLTSLVLWKCNKLKYVFSSDMVKSFVQLKLLEVRQCDEMEEVIEGILGGDEKQVFSKLDSLVLKHLPKLKRFCSGSNPIEFPSLRKLEIWTCDILNTFYTIDVGNNISHLFNQKVSFPSIQELKLRSLSRIERIWQDDSLWVTSLTSLELRECNKLKYVFSSGMVKSFVQLKSLEVKQCDEMEEVIEGILGGDEKQVFSKLDSLVLKYLPKLKRFCSGSNPIDFPSLRKLEISTFDVLNTFYSDITDVGNNISHLFNPKPKVILSVLGKLYVGGMDNFESLWPNPLAAQYSFPKLTSIYLKNCGKLLNVFPSSMVTTLQGLKELSIKHCESVEEIIFETESRLQEDGGSNSAMQSQVIQSDVVISFEFPRLTSLALVGLPNLKSIHHKMHTAKWPLLEKMKVRGCEKVEILFGCEETLLCGNGIPIQQPLFWVNQFTFPNLHCLTLGWNAGLKEIWNCYGHAQQQQLSHYFHNLKEVSLERYPKKVTTLPSYLFHLLLSVPTLQTVRIESCYFKEMMIFQSENGGEVGDDLPELFHLCKEGFQNLRILKVNKCPELIHLVPSSLSFCNLMDLSVSKCDGIIKLITHSIAKTLVQLKQMKIEECENIEVIIEGGKDDNDDDEISFPQLNTLTLASLPKLESFYSSGNYTFRFPFLKTAIVRDCPKMEMFSQQDSDTPMLHQVKERSSDDEGRWEGNLNSTIKQLFREQSAEAEEQNDMTEEPEISERVQTNPSTSNTQNLLEEGVVQNFIKDEASSSTSNAQ